MITKINPIKNLSNEEVDLLWNCVVGYECENIRKVKQAALSGDDDIVKYYQEKVNSIVSLFAKLFV